MYVRSDDATFEEKTKKKSQNPSDVCFCFSEADFILLIFFESQVHKVRRAEGLCVMTPSLLKGALLPYYKNNRSTSERQFIFTWLQFVICQLSDNHTGNIAEFTLQHAVRSNSSELHVYTVPDCVNLTPTYNKNTTKLLIKQTSSSTCCFLWLMSIRCDIHSFYCVSRSWFSWFNESCFISECGLNIKAAVTSFWPPGGASGNNQDMIESLRPQTDMTVWVSCTHFIPLDRDLFSSFVDVLQYQSVQRQA